jgi:energy-coupling factor transporter ATP-binding protein EcfA2
VVDVTSASREHRTRRTRVIALDAVSLRLAAGEAVAVLGPSGAGKTTLLNLISGLDGPTNGQVSALGNDLAAMSERLLIRFRASSVGVVPGLRSAAGAHCAGECHRGRDALAQPTAGGGRGREAPGDCRFGRPDGLSTQLPLGR